MLHYLAVYIHQEAHVFSDVNVDEYMNTDMHMNVNAKQEQYNERWMDREERGLQSWVSWRE